MSQARLMSTNHTFAGDPGLERASSDSLGFLHGGLGEAPGLKGEVPCLSYTSHLEGEPGQRGG